LALPASELLLLLLQGCVTLLVGPGCGFGLLLLAGPTILKASSAEALLPELSATISLTL
jgi:hypothetical protein